jgi:site-specific recombinase XerD
MSALLTEVEFKQQLVPTNQPKKIIEGCLTGIVSFIKVKGGYSILSRYEDDEWLFPISQGTAAAKENNLKVSFKCFNSPEQREMAKWLIFNKNKAGNTVSTNIQERQRLRSFFQWVNESDTLLAYGLTAFSAREYVKHVSSLRNKSTGKLLSSSTKANKFQALEDLFTYCHHFDFVKEHPWAESSSSEQAGHVGNSQKESRNTPKTLIIPDEVLHSLCAFTKSFMDRADELLTYKEKLGEFKPTGNNKYSISAQRKKHLKSLGWDQNLEKFNDELLLLRDSSLFWILLTTGMRIHEVLGIKRGGYRTETKEDQTFYYVKSVSEKTYEGSAEWIAPKITIEAINILSRYAESFQSKLESDLLTAISLDNVKEIARITHISGAIGLAVANNNNNKIAILSGQTITSVRLPNLCKHIKLDWKLSSHQFRRTFANYVVHSDLGDLRALKDHFKHWSLSMTALYAANPELDQELYEELLRERLFVEDEIKSDWFSLEMPITGGDIANKILELRSSDEAVKAFPNRKAMIKAFTNNIPIRATGLGWCTNDDDGCMGGKCEQCEHGVVDTRNTEYWESMLIQQLELSELDDIGESGQQAVKIGMERCENVLTALGADVETMKLDLLT